MGKKTITIHREHFAALKAIGSVETGKLILSLIEQADGKEALQLEETTKRIERMMIDKFEQIAAYRSVNGKKGGAPKGNQNARKKGK